MLEHPQLTRVIDVYGGMKRWRKLDRIVIEIDALGGPLPLTKGLGRTFSQPRVVTIQPSLWRAEAHDYPQPGERAVFDAGAVTLSTRTLVGYRKRFRGLGKCRCWKPADCVYFFSYALCTYFSVPFILPEYATSVTAWNGGIRVVARFPETLDTHSVTQEFWFGRDGLVLRHDYCADIVGRWATGAHSSSDYEIINGLPIARNRQVFGRLFHTSTGIPVLSARLHPLEVKYHGD